MNQFFSKRLRLVLAVFGLGYGQIIAQNPDWPIVPNLHHFTTNGPSAQTTMPGAYPAQYFASNCARDASGNLMFYVVDEKIYDAGGNLIGNASAYPNGKDILILPDPNDCNARLVLAAHTQTIPNGGTHYHVCFLDVTRVIMIGSTLTVQPNVFNYTIYGNDNHYISMALSQPKSSGDRILYLVTSKGAHQFKIGTSGITYGSTVLFGFEAQATDAELSPSGDKLMWPETDNHGELLWLNLDIATGAFLSAGVNSRPVNPMGWYRVYGLEFIDNTRFMVSAVRTSPNGPVSGIFLCTGFGLELAPSINPNAAYSLSQLEKAVDGKIYAASASDLWGVDPNNLTSTTTIPGAVNSNRLTGFPAYYSLPKQLDYEDYSTLFRCCKQNVTITGVYNVPLTESKTWIVSSGACSIAASSTVKLDADPVNGYIQLNTGFTANAAQNVVFVAQALDGCGTGVPLRPQVVEERDTEAYKPEIKTENGTCKIFPNPTSGETTIDFGAAIEMETSLTVMDLTGRAVLQTTVQKGESSRRFSLGSFPSGIYVLRAMCNGKPILTEKLIKE